MLFGGVLLACSLLAMSPAYANTECSDGIDNDYDGGQDNDLNIRPGLIDYHPTPGLGDPDCTSANDTSEVFLRQPLCAADGEHRIRAVFAHTDANPPPEAALQRVRDYVAMVNGWLWKDAQRLGTTRDFKVKCNANGVTDVLVISSYPNVLWSIEQAIGASVLEHYWIFNHYCPTCPATARGGALGCTGELPLAENCGNYGPSYAEAHGDGNVLSDNPSEKWLPALVMAQEALHAMGIMGRCAPNNDEQPLDGTVHTDGFFYPYYMCATTGVLGKSGSHGLNGPDPMSKGVMCNAPAPFDCNNDDFFHPEPPPGNYLYNSFNLGASYVNWIDGDGIYPWRGYMFSAANWLMAVKEITRTASSPNVEWFRQLTTGCAVPEKSTLHWAGGDPRAGFAYAFARSPTCNYGTGAVVNTQLTFDVNLARTYLPTIKWDQWYDFRSNCGNCDKVTVDYSTDGGSTWTTVWTLTNPGDQNAWTTTPTYTLAGAACKGNVKIRFAFDSISSVPAGDSSKGWYVDGIRIVGPEGGCSEIPTAPLALTAQHVGGPTSPKVKLDWVAPVHDGDDNGQNSIVGYVVYRNNQGVGNGGAKSPVGSLACTSSPPVCPPLTYTDTLVTNAGRYYYEIAAVTVNSKLSPRSNEARALPDLYFGCPATTSTSGTVSNCANMQNSDDANAVATLTEAKTCSTKWCLSQTHDASGVGPVGDWHTLHVRGRQVTNAETLYVQVYDFATGGYTSRITFATGDTALTLKAYVLTASEWNNGSPRIRYLHATNDGKQTTWQIDYAKVVSK